VSDGLLRAILSEVRSIHFTEKTTDIYRIWQSGDLANLDGLDAAAFSALPALRQLRDALYSTEFRAYLSDVTGEI
jgi:prolyl 3-hydroxylase /prolyl 3,4-dihydroxylase